MGRRSEQEKNEILERYHVSGQTQRAFAESEGISEHVLSKWLNRNSPTKRSSFIEVPLASRTEVEIRFPDGSVVTVRG
jgi:transposase-like protein